MSVAEARQGEIERAWNDHFGRATGGAFRRSFHMVGLDDRRVIGVPLAWFPRLLHGSPAARDAVMLSPSGLHRDTLDISIAGSSLAPAT